MGIDFSLYDGTTGGVVPADDTTNQDLLELARIVISKI